jgi:hypothetical protein
MWFIQRYQIIAVLTVKNPIIDFFHQSVFIFDLKFLSFKFYLIEFLFAVRTSVTCLLRPRIDTSETELMVAAFNVCAGFVLQFFDANGADFRLFHVLQFQ